MKKQKGQDLIEYALMLALVVGIGGFIYTQGYGDNISAVFNNAGSLLEQVNKSQEEAKEEAEKAAAREADRNYADYLGDLLKNAVTNESIKLSNGSSVYLLVQNEPNSRYNNLHMNGAKTGGTVRVKDANGNLQDYSSAGFNTMLNAVGGDYSNAAVHQSDVDWYGVGITNNGDDHYTLSFVQGKGYKDDSRTRFDVNAGQKYKESESWTK